MQAQPIPSKRDERARRKEAIGAWLGTVMQQTGLKATPLGTAAGVPPSSVLRALNPDEPGTLDLDSVDKIVRKFGVPLPTRIFGEPTAPGFAAPDLVPLALDAPAISAFGPLAATQAVWEVKGRTLELAGYLPGDLLLVDSALAPATREPLDVVCAQVLDAGGAETVLRLYDPPYLLTQSADPHWRRKPLLVDNAQVAIWGVVCRSLRLRKS